MLSATLGSQFVRSLFLFVRRDTRYLPRILSDITFQSQTQGGTRYTRQLTRFYATVSPSELFGLLERALDIFVLRTSVMFQHSRADRQGNGHGWYQESSVSDVKFVVSISRRARDDIQALYTVLKADESV